jgi:hypothetical protein
MQLKINEECECSSGQVGVKYIEMVNGCRKIVNGKRCCKKTFQMPGNISHMCKKHINKTANELDYIFSSFKKKQ